MLCIASFPITAFAVENEEAIGSIEIVLEDGSEKTSKEGVVFAYGKIANIENGSYKLLKQYEKLGVEINDISTSEKMEKVIRELDKCDIRDGKVQTDKEGRARISPLSQGVYFVSAIDRGNYDEVQSLLVEVPMWNENTKSMHYDVCVSPKHSPKEPERVVTGDDSSYLKYMGISLISIILVVGLTCHNRFKCGKIAGNYSEKGGYTHGNDNDTKNPRCTRRTRSRGGRSIN